MSSREAWRLRDEAWARFASWTPPSSERERATRLAWLDGAIALARRLGRLPPAPLDTPEDRDRRRRTREALSRVRA